jgi:hypothetical protein
VNLTIAGYAPRSDVYRKYDQFTDLNDVDGARASVEQLNCQGWLVGELSFEV